MKGDGLSVKRLSIALCGADRSMILQDVSLAVPGGAIVGIVGGSGSGKTTLGMSVLGLVPPAMKIVSGEILFEGQDLVRLPSVARRLIRGRRIGMVFQEPMSALDPVFTIGAQIAETILAHEQMTSQALETRLIDLLSRVKIPDPKRVLKSYPHELSGGLRQRAMIALAIACGPSLLIADEPTSSLDVTLQAHIIGLFRELRNDLGLSILLISHDLGMVSRLADEVAVMAEGKIVERGAAGGIMTGPRHAYTRRLIAAGSL